MISWLAPPPLKAEMLDLLGRAWVCEQHPDKPWPHDGCEGPGRLREGGNGDLP
jgi:hypothetical protein